MNAIAEVPAGSHDIGKESGKDGNEDKNLGREALPTVLIVRWPAQPSRRKPLLMDHSMVLRQGVLAKILRDDRRVDTADAQGRHDLLYLDIRDAWDRCFVYSLYSFSKRHMLRGPLRVLLCVCVRLAF